MPSPSGNSFTVASVQAAPVFLNRKKSIAKACTLIRRAARKGARLIVFPEAFVPAYPDWVWTVPPGNAGIARELYGELLDQSVSIPSSETDQLCRAAQAAGAYVVMGVNERNAEASGASIYNTLLYIDDRGQIMGKHQKLVPTAAERLVWAAGDGSTLGAYDTALGKLGGLICWENYMPLARYAMYAWGTQIYVAATWDSAESWLGTLQHIAREGRCFVIGSCIAMRKDEIPDRYEFKALYPNDHEWINIGSTHAITADMVKPGAVIIDVGNNWIEDSTRKSGRRLVGDVDYGPVSEIAGAITPVPGGVGPMTIAMLLSNTVWLAERSSQNG